MSHINSYSKKWELEGQFETAEEVAEEWMVDVGDVYDALDDLTLINNRYLVLEEELGIKLQAISTIIEEGLLDVLGDSLDKEDDRLIMYQVELKQEVERSRQYKHDFETVSRKYMTVEHEKDMLLKQGKDLEDQLQIATSNHQHALKQAEEYNKLATKVSQELAYTSDLLAQVEEILKGGQGDSVSQQSGGQTGVSTLTDGGSLEQTLLEEELKQELEEELEPEAPGNQRAKSVGGKSKKIVKARVKWEQVLSNPSFPLLTELKEKKFWHVSELASKLSKPPRSIITESDLDFIVHKVFSKLGYKKNMPNPKLLNAEEATWIILASYYNSDTTLVGLERLTKSVEVLYDDWNTNHALIKQTLKKG